MIRIQNLKFKYPQSTFELNIDELTIGPQEKVAVIGPSGCGKTTLLNLLSGICTPQVGTIDVEGQSVSGMSDSQRRDFRSSRIGMVFQQFELIEYLSVLENIMLPYLVNRNLVLGDAVRQKAQTSASEMGLADKTKRLPQKLSQGERQRVAICRALVNDPGLILADEPTGNLDPSNKHRTLQLLNDYCRRTESTLIVVTHDTAILDGFDRVIDFEQLLIQEKPS